MWPFTSNSQPKVIHTSERRLCWESRDQLFACLDAHGIISAEDKAAKQTCAAEYKLFNENCVKVWVDYFVKKRIADAQKAARIQQLEAAGYKPLEAPLEITEIDDPSV